MKKLSTILIFALWACSSKDNLNESSMVKTNSDTIKSDLKKTDSIYRQECNYTDLSKMYDYRISFKRIINQDHFDSCIVKVFILKKGDTFIYDSIIFSSNGFFQDVFERCDKSRSYLTGKNLDQIASDNDYGNLIVADFNFDSKEDFAVINDSGGNGGVFYSFYTQDDNKKFNCDNFLTDSMTYFPNKIDNKNKTLMTLVHAGVCHLGQHKYKMNERTNVWTQTSHKLINICEK